MPHYMDNMCHVSPFLGAALDIITAAVDLYPDSRNLALHHAELLAECGKPQDALAACEKYLTRFGVHERILELGLELRRNSIGRQTAPVVSLCMIVKNEERYLARCLASVKPVVDEMIVVDTGSDDGTVPIAELFGAAVHRYSWTGNFSDARNYALDQARGTWILTMDADERLAAQDHDAFRRTVLNSSPADAWSVPIRNYSERVHVQGWTANDGTYPDEEQADGWYPATRVRLFPRCPLVRFEGVVHELVEPSLRRNAFTIRPAGFPVHHYGEVDGLPANLHDKQRYYYELGKQKLAAQPDNIAALTELAVQAGELGLFADELELWDRFLGIKPDSAEALFGKGHALINLKRYSEALDASRRAVERDPANREAAFNCGTCELYVGAPMRALPEIEQSLKRGGSHPLLQALLITLCLAVGDSDKAGRLYREFAENKYDLSGYLGARIATLVTVGRNELACTIRNNAAKIGLSL